MPTSSLDDILLGVATNVAPQTPEHQPEIEPELEAGVEAESTQTDDDVPRGTEESDFPSLAQAYDDRRDEALDAAKNKEPDTDDYGNPKAAARTYNEDEVNERINVAVRERLARLERNNPAPNQQQVQQAANAGFEYDADSSQTWQQQLERFVEQTVTNLNQRQAQQAQQYKERQAQAEFESKFQQGMGKFGDFSEVVGKQPITDAMVMGARAIQDPAAFFYAASKREPKELERISRIADPIAQVAEIGRLEERMKRNKPVTKTPRPVGKTTEDANMPGKNAPKEMSIEEMIAADAKVRLAMQRQRTSR